MISPSETNAAVDCPLPPSARVSITLHSISFPLGSHSSPPPPLYQLEHRVRFADIRVQRQCGGGEELRQLLLYFGSMAMVGKNCYSSCYISVAYIRNEKILGVIFTAYYFKKIISQNRS
ncbi:hypothetical protein Droror1_Dr00011198 [Drosera rotundifolia]